MKGACVLQGRLCIRRGRGKKSVQGNKSETNLLQPTADPCFRGAAVETSDI